ncbi:MAG TPA: metallopeptidase TldD-related protein [Anaerolineae bacterium]|nr:metallopeptidase TldD-related protein [Anaerolineae bacterium]
MDKQVELIERNLDVTRVGCKFSRVKSIERQSYYGRAARVIANGKAGHASTTDGLTDDQLVQRAGEMAHVTVPKALSFPSESVIHQPTSSDVDQFSDNDLRDWTRQMLRTMRQNNPHLAIELNVSRIKEEVALRNTNGGEAHLSRSWLEAETWIERHADGEVLVALDRFATAQVDDSHLDFARRMARRFRWARKPIVPVSGPQSVIFSPSAFASLLEPMLMAFNGSFVFNSNSRGGKRRSGFASKIGKQEFDPKFSLFDDATLPDRPYSAWVDHEGTRSQCTPLISNGVVAGFYHNLISAAQAEVRSTGNGWRDMLEPPMPAPTNVRVQGGDVTLSDMLQNMNDGLLIDLIGASDGAIGLTGEFSRTVVLAYQIKRGRVAGYVRGASVSGDLYRSLQNIESLSCDGYWSDDIFTPYIQLGNITISA